MSEKKAFFMSVMSDPNESLIAESEAKGSDAVVALDEEKHRKIFMGIAVAIAMLLTIAFVTIVLRNL